MSLPPYPPQPVHLDPVQIMLQQQGTIAQDVSALRVDVGKALTRLELVDQRNKISDADHVDFETRLRILERFRWTVTGVSLVAGFASGFVGYLLGHAVH